MQTILNLPEEQVQQLDQLSHARNLSRDEVVSLALTAYIQSRKDAFDQSFGAWGGAKGDGVEYQRRIRSEWR